MNYDPTGVDPPDFSAHAANRRAAFRDNLLRKAPEWVDRELLVRLMTEDWYEERRADFEREEEEYRTRMLEALANSRSVAAAEDWARGVRR